MSDRFRPARPPRARRGPRLRPVALLLALLGLLLAPLPAFAAHLGVNVTPDTSAYGTQTGNVYFVYVEEGEWLHTWGNGGSGWIYRPGETEPFLDGVGTGGAGFSTPREITEEYEGVWTIRYGGASNWNVTVYDGDPELPSGTNPVGQPVAGGVDEIPGRVWVSDYSLSQSGGAVNEKEISFWAVDDSGYQYAIRLLGYNGVNSTISANSMGMPLGESGSAACTPSYRSWDTDDLDGSAVTGSDESMACANRFRLFFEPPAPDLPASAPVQPTEYNGHRSTQTIVPPPVDPAAVNVDGFTFTPDGPGSPTGTFDYDLGASFFGSHLLQIDVNGNGTFDDPDDREIRIGAQGVPVSYEFDGLDGQGAAIPSCTPMNARVYLDRVGEIHIVHLDLEALSGGIEVIRQNGPGAPDPTIHWDDTQTGPKSNDITIPDPADVPDPRDGTAGVDSTGGTHAWDYATRSWGDSKYIDNYTFQQVDEAKGSVQIAGACLEVEKTSDTTLAPRVGETVGYTVTATNTGAEDYTAANPAVVVDDLAAVLDDATGPVALSATVGGAPVTAPTFDDPRVTWSGPLASGDSVEISYQVVVTGAGDGILDNVAFAPPEGEDPATFPKPDCMVGTGFDASAGVYCSTTDDPIARLEIDKSADRTELPAVGETVEYTVTATSVGPGAFTDGNPAVVIDDLSGVLDDATLVAGSVTADQPGDLVEDGDRISWTGALGVGDSVTLRYELTYTVGGDHELVNVAFGGLDTDTPTPACPAAGTDPATGLPCAPHLLPGAGLVVGKSVDPASGSSVRPGTVLTYTLSFANVGGAAATVDHVDHLAGVLDDADVVAAPSSATLTVSAISAGAFSIGGSVPPGEIALVSYRVRVKAHDQQGDRTLANFVTGSGETPPATCAPASGTCTANFAEPPPAPAQPRTQPRIQTKASAPRARLKVRKNGSTGKVRLFDRVRIRGFVPGGTAKGRATLYGPTTQRNARMCRPANRVGTVRFTPRNGTVRTPAIRVSEPGHYTWVVEITGDERNRPVSHRCGLKAETTLVHRPKYGPVRIDTGADEESGLLARLRDRARVRLPQVGLNAVLQTVGRRGGAMVIPGNIARAGWLRDSAAPGERVGKTVIAGHVSDNRDRPGQFGRLRGARKGQVVTVTGADGKRHRYRVTRIIDRPRSQQLPKSLFSTGGAHRLVLVTCSGRRDLGGGRFTYTRNHVVIAKPID